MNVHQNARLTPAGRALLAARVERGWSVKAAARAAGVSARTAHVAEMLPSFGQDDATAFLKRALAWFGRLGVTVERVMTDKDSAYRSKSFAAALTRAGIRHVRTRPYTPRTNGKAERSIQTSLREWAYARPYASSAERLAAIGPWASRYNLSRPHSALGDKPPWTRLNNLLGNDT